MIPGAVGFQCPDCVAAGRRETRQGVLPYGGRRGQRPELTSYALIALNALVFVGVWMTGGAFGRLFDALAIKTRGYCMLDADRLLDIPQQQCVAEGLQWVDGVATGAWWQVLSNAFTHADLMHIGFNMLALYFLGPQLERVFGRARFLAIYLVAAVMASAFIMLFANTWTSTVGASGAVFGLMGAIALVAYKHKGNMRTILVWIGANVVITVAGASFISWQGHLGGFVGGLAVAAAVMYTPKARRPRMQWVLVGAITVVALGIIAARAVQLG